nr:MAG TPA: hypothetical protein [Bacteriophage sp.]
MLFIIVTSFIYIYNWTVSPSISSCIIVCPILFKIT